MQIRRLILTAICGLVALAAVAPAFADDDWRRHEHEVWRERAWRQHEWREHEWREHEWREHAYAPPVVVAPRYGYYPAPAYRPYPGYYH